jgi:imidazolonepropionase-like amidohydrolase
MKTLLVCLLTTVSLAQVTAIRAGHLIDPETGTSAANQVILVEAGKITAIGANLAIPAGAQTIDLSAQTVLPGLVDAHNHRDLGNAGNYADTALRQAIDQGWIPGPTIINSGIIIGGFGGQFTPTPERAELVYPEYLDADTPDEIVKAVRKNILFGAKVIKIMVDSKSYGYTVDEMKLFVAEAAKSGMKVAGHVQTPAGARRAIEAGICQVLQQWSRERVAYPVKVKTQNFLSTDFTDYTD